jgi:hypothetical protein
VFSGQAGPDGQIRVIGPMAPAVQNYSFLSLDSITFPNTGGYQD